MFNFLRLLTTEQLRRLERRLLFARQPKPCLPIREDAWTMYYRVREILSIR